MPKKLIAGVNDLATLHPEVAAEADDWDPSTIIDGSRKKKRWKCNKGHTWDATVSDRTIRKSGCPYCANKKVWIGFNDLKTKYPEIAKEADGWDPSTVVAGTHKKMRWKCDKGHTWDALIYRRTGSGGVKGTNCPYCTNKKIWVGFNDLQTKFPAIAKEADGWDPSKILSGIGKKLPWKCEKGHTWNATPNNRTVHSKGCPYCSNQKVLTGFNDLKTKYPEIAKEVDGWDASMVLAGSAKKKSWKCKEGHTWEATIDHRTSGEHGCPYCANHFVWTGFNDLYTKFPDIAAEADGWNPSTVVAGTHKKMRWKCDKGHTWDASVASRTSNGSGCPECAESGFNRGKPAWFYLMSREGEQQLGITNFLDKRMQYHSYFGWELIEATGPHDGKLVLEMETLLKSWIKKEVGLVPDKTENWYTSKMEVHSLAELKEKSGIETSIF